MIGMMGGMGTAGAASGAAGAGAGAMGGMMDPQMLMSLMGMLGNAGGSVQESGAGGQQQPMGLMQTGPDPMMMQSLMQQIAQRQKMNQMGRPF